MTHVVHEVSLIDAVTLRRRSLNLHSCAGGSLQAPGCCSVGCDDCHCGNGDVRVDEDDGNDGWLVRGLCSKAFATPEDIFMKL